jgi:hypothetical protein
MKYTTLLQLISAGVETPSGCIEWQGNINTSGYGSIKRQGFVHRIAWTLANGEIPEGMHVMHTCDNKKCYNPEHLMLGTRSDNMRDFHSKHKLKKRENLTSEEVISIITLLKYTDLSGLKISKMMGIDGTIISKIKLGRNHHKVMPHIERPIRPHGQKRKNKALADKRDDEQRSSAE